MNYLVRIATVGLAVLGASSASQMGVAQTASTEEPPGQFLARHIALDIIRMEACRSAWNYHVSGSTSQSFDIAKGLMPSPEASHTTINDVAGLKYEYLSNDPALSGDLCGWYFIPDGGSALSQRASTAQKNTLRSEFNILASAGEGILSLIPAHVGAPEGPIEPKVGTDILEAIAQYQKGLVSELNANGLSEADFATAVAGSITISQPLKALPEQTWLQKWNNNEDALAIRKRTLDGVRTFDNYLSSELKQSL